MDAKLYRVLTDKKDDEVLHLCQKLKPSKGGPMHKVTIHGDSVLHVALHTMQVKLVDKLLNMSYDRNLLTRANAVGNNVLHEAATHDEFLPVAKKLLQLQPQLLTVMNKDLETPLFSAARYGQMEMFKFFDEVLYLNLEDDTIMDDEYCETFHRKLDDGSTTLHAAIDAEHFELAVWIAQKHKYLHRKKNDEGLTALQLLACNPLAFRFRGEGWLKAFIDSRIKSRKEDEDSSDLQRGKVTSAYSVPWWDKTLRKRRRYNAAVDLAKLLIKNDMSWKRTKNGDEENDESDEENDESTEENDESDEENDESTEENDESDEENDESTEENDESDEENDESTVVDSNNGKKKIEAELKKTKAELKKIEALLTKAEFEKIKAQQKKTDQDQLKKIEAQLKKTDRDQLKKIKAELKNFEAELTRIEDQLKKTDQDELKKSEAELKKIEAELEKIEAQLKKTYQDELEKIEAELKKIEAHLKKTDQDELKMIETKKKNGERQQIPLLLATQTGCFEIVKEILKLHPQAVEYIDKNGRTILHIAIKYRQMEIFKMVHEEMEVHMSRLIQKCDLKGNSILHMVGKRIRNKDVEQTQKRSPFFQLQEDLLLFERMKEIIKPHFYKHTNKNGKTAEELLAINKEALRDKSQEWLKRTAENCSIIAILIATVAFAAAYTVPGGSNPNGSPVLLNQTFFVIFTIGDVLSLTFCLTAVIIFLSILTSSYQLQEFKLALPQKLMLGITCLLFSVTMMMLAFSATIILMIHHNEQWSKIALYTVALLPVTVLVIVYMSLYLSLMKTFKYILEKMGSFFPRSNSKNIDRNIGADVLVVYTTTTENSQSFV